MNKYKRVQTHQEGIINAPANKVWKQLLHWGGIMVWWPKENPPAPLTGSPLNAGQTEQDLPRTRNCQFDTNKLPPSIEPSVLPSVVQETLLYLDEDARFIYYNMEGIGPFGLRNYLATTEVDVLANKQTRIICRSRFDAPEDAPIEMLKAFIESIHSQGIIRGFKNNLE